jgi:CheY-specific phosphatase CheX
MVNDLVESTQEVFATMLFQDAVSRPSRPAVSREPRADVVATIHLTGPSRAVIGLYCSEAGGQVDGRLDARASMPRTSTTSIRDALGELANMIGGSFRNRMAESVARGRSRCRPSRSGPASSRTTRPTSAA